MAEKSLLDGKMVLIVDDEPDVLESIEGLLTMCDVMKATSFEQAKELLEKEYFDIAILDIMGVQGYELLEIAKKMDVIPVMLTAHSLSVEDTVRSYKEGAASFVPKEEMANIATFLVDILEAKEQGQNFWWRWLKRFSNYYERKFGPEWRDKDLEFWERFPDSWL